MLAPRVLGLLACGCYLGLVSAADQLSLDGIPSCAINCMLEALPATTCSAVDQACLCSDEVFNAAVAPCVRSQCSIKEGLAATNASYAQCGIPSRDQTSKVRWVSTVVIACASGFMAMRLTTKAAKLSVWGHDDTAAVVAFVVILAAYGQSFYFTEVGLGKEVWTLHDYEITTFLKAGHPAHRGSSFFFPRRLFLLLEFVYFVGLAVIKASILFFFLRIFPDRRFRRFIWAVQILNLLVCLAFVILCFAQCRPFSHFWDGWDGEHKGTCLNLNKIGLIHVALNIGLDVVMLVLPVTQIYKLQMDMRKKIGVIAMFQVGIFLSIVSVLRIRSLSDFAFSINLTADSVAIVLWGYVEMGVGLIVACMPSTWHLLKMIPSKVTQLTTTVASNIGSSGVRTRPNSQVLHDKPARMSLMETRSYRSNSTPMPTASSSRRPSGRLDEFKVGLAL
ncbi:integral membrane protein [Colletotrichum falcatum]|nr:integral membrane protein [Colletotrichum falcatum]